MEVRENAILQRDNEILVRMPRIHAAHRRSVADWIDDALNLSRLYSSFSSPVVRRQDEMISLGVVL